MLVLLSLLALPLAATVACAVAYRWGYADGRDSLSRLTLPPVPTLNPKPIDLRTRAWERRS